MQPSIIESNATGPTLQPSNESNFEESNFENLLCGENTPQDPQDPNPEIFESQENMKPNGVVPEVAESNEDIQSEVPQKPMTPEDDNEVSHAKPVFKLPARTNRGKPPKRYVPEDGTSKEVKFPIANYTTTDHLCEPLKAFVNQIASVIVPEKTRRGIK
jgi:hypothetical protein